jgi:hypothetical protein
MGYQEALCFAPRPRPRPRRPPVSNPFFPATCGGSCTFGSRPPGHLSRALQRLRGRNPVVRAPGTRTVVASDVGSCGDLFSGATSRRCSDASAKASPVADRPGTRTRALQSQLSDSNGSSIASAACPACVRADAWRSFEPTAPRARRRLRCRLAGIPRALSLRGSAILRNPLVWPIRTQPERASKPCGAAVILEKRRRG